ncbi:MAG TPA: hypothetical protein VFD49_12795 [Candidatus Dormibacteraeota bacterium]|nr:hypothetical protein [Candidatus Dormibacteraeota bacterium]
MTVAGTKGGSTLRERVEATAALVERRGYALPPERLGQLCLGGPVSAAEVLAAVAADRRLVLREGLVVTRRQAEAASAIAARARGHALHAPLWTAVTRRFVRTLVRLNPYVLGVAIAGSLASGGFTASDDVDLNLIVEDGHRHLAYVALNLLGIAHALRHRSKPVDAHSRRPLAPRLMTANLILERSQCFPLARQDPAMAFELLVSRPIHGLEAWRRLLVANPRLREHFPQLDWPDEAIAVRPWLPAWAFPRGLDRAARLVGEAGWRWMQWTRRRHPEARARVAYVRETMRPYALFDR